MYRGRRSISPELAMALERQDEPTRKLILDALDRQDYEDSMEFLQSAQDQSAAKAPGRIGSPIQFQQRAMFNPANLAGTGGSLLQMSPPFNPSIRSQLQQVPKKEDRLFGSLMRFV